MKETKTKNVLASTGRNCILDALFGRNFFWTQKESLLINEVGRFAINNNEISQRNACHHFQKVFEHPNKEIAEHL